ncbi:MAG: cytochrome c [Nitrospirota bacterium]
MFPNKAFSIVRHPGGIPLMGVALWLMTGVEANGQKEMIEKGRGLYQRLCSACHGKAESGDGYALFNPPPADLKASATQEETDEELLNTIRNGHPNTAMGKWEYALSEGELREVLAYIRTFGGTTSCNPNLSLVYAMAGYKLKIGYDGGSHVKRNFQFCHSLETEDRGGRLRWKEFHRFLSEVHLPLRFGAGHITELNP